MNTEITSDGSLHLHVPTGLPPGPAEIVVVIQPAASRRHMVSDPPYPSDEGVWVGKMPDIDVDAALEEMNAAWPTRLDVVR
jgi:hypothetical protein